MIKVIYVFVFLISKVIYVFVKYEELGFVFMVTFFNTNIFLHVEVVGCSVPCVHLLTRYFSP